MDKIALQGKCFYFPAKSVILCCTHVCWMLKALSMSRESKNCFICAKHRGEVSIPGGAIYEDNLIYVGHVKIREEQSTAYLGHLIVETKRHNMGLADLTDAEAQIVGLFVTRFSRALKISADL